MFISQNCTFQHFWSQTTVLYKPVTVFVKCTLKDHQLLMQYKVCPFKITFTQALLVLLVLSPGTLSLKSNHHMHHRRSIMNNDTRTTNSKHIWQQIISGCEGLDQKSTSCYLGAHFQVKSLQSQQYRGAHCLPWAKALVTEQRGISRVFLPQCERNNSG